MRPGSKPDQGSFRTREALALKAGCSRCGSELEGCRVEEASITDLPAVIRPRVRLFRVGLRRCKSCGATARGRNPDLAPDQRGATAHRLGPQRLAAAHRLPYYILGAPAHKLPTVLKMPAGIRLPQGAVALDAMKRTSAVIGSTYRSLV